MWLIFLVMDGADISSSFRCEGDVKMNKNPSEFFKKIQIEWSLIKWCSKTPDKYAPLMEGLTFIHWVKLIYTHFDLESCRKRSPATGRASSTATNQSMELAVRWVSRMCIRAPLVYLTKNRKFQYTQFSLLFLGVNFHINRFVGHTYLLVRYTRLSKEFS